MSRSASHAGEQREAQGVAVAVIDVGAIVRRIFSHAAGVSLAEIVDEAYVATFAIDSVTSAAAGTVLEIELDISIGEEDLAAVFGSERVVDAIRRLEALVSVATAPYG